MEQIISQKGSVWYKKTIVCSQNLITSYKDLGNSREYSENWLPNIIESVILIFYCRELHQIPELGFEEERTSAFVRYTIMCLLKSIVLKQKRCLKLKSIDLVMCPRPRICARPNSRAPVPNYCSHNKDKHSYLLMPYLAWKNSMARYLQIIFWSLGGVLAIQTMANLAHLTYL